MKTKLLALLLGWGALMAACPAEDRGEASLEPIKLGIGYIPDIQFSPLYVGIDKGFYRQENLDLTIEHGFTVDVFALLQSDKLDIGLTDSDKLIADASQQSELKAFFQYYTDVPVSIVAKSSRISRPTDLIGRTIGVPALFGSSWIGFLVFLKEFNLSREEVSIENIGYTQIQALVGDLVDGVSVFFNNEVQKLNLMGERLSRWDIRDFSPLVGAPFIARDKDLTTKADVYAAFCRATRRAINYVLKNKPETLAITRNWVVMTKEGAVYAKEVLEATSSLFGPPDQPGRIEKNRYQDSIEILREFGIIEDVFPAEQIISEAFN